MAPPGRSSSRPGSPLGRTASGSDLSSAATRSTSSAANRAKDKDKDRGASAQSGGKTPRRNTSHNNIKILDDDISWHNVRGDHDDLFPQEDCCNNEPTSNSRTKPAMMTMPASSSPSAFAEADERYIEEEREERILVAERDARKRCEQNILYLFVADFLSSLLVYTKYLITINSVVGVALTAMSTSIAYNKTKEQQDVFVGAMDWALLGFAIVLPLSAIVRLAFLRREAALTHIVEFKSNALAIYMAHADWNWEGGKGRDDSSVDSLKHSDRVIRELIKLGDDLCRYLTLPITSRARHRELPRGRTEASVVSKCTYLLLDSMIARRMPRLSRMAEDLKDAGLSATESSRLRQFERFIVKSIEQMRIIKNYRTPLALRAFANIFTLLIPPFYAPAFAQLAFDTNSYALGMVFGVVTSLALTALFESVNHLEDPFVANLTLDGIDVHEELSVLYWHQLVNTRKFIFPHAPPLGGVDSNPNSQEEEEDEMDYIGFSSHHENIGFSSHGRFFGKKVPKKDLGSSEASRKRISHFQDAMPTNVSMYGASFDKRNAKNAMVSTMHGAGEGGVSRRSTAKY